MTNNLSPMMLQYIDLKEKNKECILFFRVGDFYETFFDDAKVVSKELNLVLTGKDCGMEEKAPMCGVPYHSVETYINKLIKFGHKVAIAEQLEDPKLAKGIVKRDITRIITPGTNLSNDFLQDKINNYIISIYYQNDIFGVSLLDFSTGELFIDNISGINKILDFIYKYNPTEIVYNSYINNIYKFSENYYFKNLSINTLNENYFDIDKLNEFDYIYKLLKNFDEYKKYKNTNAINSLVGLISYIKNNQKIELSQIKNINYIVDDDYMYLDSMTLRNLEVVETMRDKEKEGSLLGVLDYTKTAMGGRYLRNALLSPLKNTKKIKYRQDGIADLINNYVLLNELREHLFAVYDLHRLNTRFNLKTANARDIIALYNSIKVLPYIYKILENFNSDFFIDIKNEFDMLHELKNLIEKAIVDDPPFLLHDGGIIKDGFDEEVDRLRNFNLNGKKLLIDFKEREKTKNNIKNLKVKYNHVYGYLIEISNVYKGDIPKNYIRKQTLTNAERYVTDELIELNNNLLSANDRLKNIEYEIFVRILEEINKYTNRIIKISNIIAKIDFISSIAYASYKNDYVCPKINTKNIIKIVEGRHPVIEKINSSENFIPNDTYLDDENYIDIITGPNMAGKSTYMRQIALIVLLFQIGSYVPCKEADLCIVDRIFTRVGASDDLSRGQSTFMVEMVEVANILLNATDKSLLILDEIGRGTSTYDGLSIAYAVVEYISKKIKAKTLFATHYHELTELENKINGVNNFNISVLENDDEIKFLRKIERGKAKKSYGIAVAKLAGIPNVVIERSKTILEEMLNKHYIEDDEKEKLHMEINDRHNEKNIDRSQLINFIKNINVDNLTPFEAINKLYDIKELLDMEEG